MTHSIRNFVRLAVLAVGLSLFLFHQVWAQGSAFTYQGNLNNNNVPGNGNFDFEFKLFDLLAGGLQMGGTLQRLNVAVSNGNFNVSLDFDATAFSGAPRYLEISVRPAGGGAFTVLTPRQAISPTPYAIRSAVATASDSLSPACIGCVTSTQIQGGGAYINNTTTQQAGANFNIGGNGIVGGNLIANGNVGIGINNPAFLLDVRGGATQYSIYGQNNSNAGNVAGVAGSSTNGWGVYGTTFGGAGVNGRAFGVNGIGVFGESDQFNGVRGVGHNINHGAVVGVHDQGGFGVYGESNTGAGVVGISKGANAGVYGESDQFNGVRGVAHNSFHGAVVGVHDGGGVGVYGESNLMAIYGGSTGTSGVGVAGEASGGVFSYPVGVWGKSTHPNGLAGRFAGNVEITGNISKGGGAFRIDHPLDPANKYLSHSFVESPDMMNIYNGNVTTDENGEAQVTLPDYFTALNRDYRYQLTVLGQFAQAIVSEKVKDNRFRIRTSLPNVEVSWQVTGIRQDAWANAHRIQTEEDKPKPERGYYLHPELFSQPEEKSTEWAQRPDLMKRMKEERERPRIQPTNPLPAPAARPNNR